MTRAQTLGLLLLLSPPSLASDMNLSGRYRDVGGDVVVISQAAQSLSVLPDMEEMPSPAREYLGEIKLTGKAVEQPEKQFHLTASYRNTVEPNPHLKLKMTVEFSAQGQQTDEGLVMKVCEWKAHMIVYADGEIAGSENLAEKCVGLWKKSPP